MTPAGIMACNLSNIVMEWKLSMECKLSNIANLLVNSVNFEFDKSFDQPLGDVK